MTSFLLEEELNNLRKSGIKIGSNTKISRFVQFYGTDIQIGDNVRIDDFCILSGNIKIGSNIHISAYVALYGKGGIIIEDYSGISPRCSLFSASDDFSGEYMIGPMVNVELTNVNVGKIHLYKYTQIGTGTVIMPNVLIKEGAVVGAMSLVKETINPWTIAYGIPAESKKPRSKNILKLINNV